MRKHRGLRTFYVISVSKIGGTYYRAVMEAEKRNRKEGKHEGDFSQNEHQEI